MRLHVHGHNNAPQNDIAFFLPGSHLPDNVSYTTRLWIRAVVLHLKVMVTGSKGRSPSSWEGCRFSMPTGALNVSTPTFIV